MSTARRPSWVSEARKFCRISLSAPGESAFAGSPKDITRLRISSVSSSCVVSTWPTTSREESSSDSSVRTSVVLPAPISPLTTTKPEGSDRPRRSVARASWWPRLSK